MRISIERLRVGLLAMAGLLVLATVVFLGYGRFRAKHFLTELPKKLGADIRQETNALTWSQTVKGRTVFTVHAAKAIQHNNGKYILQDVGIVLYGQVSGQPNRVDRIYGKEFEYDQNAGVIRAMGEVHLDLQAPAPADPKAKMDYAAGKDLKNGTETGRGAGESGEKDERLIRVKTSGLVFLRQLGVAATEQDIEFEYGGLTGHARGADYSSDTGVLVLHSAVQVNGLENGKPIVLTAVHAELDRMNHKAILTQAKYVSVGEPSRQTAEAQHAVVYTRADGSMERLEAQGAVTLTDSDGGRVTADRGEAVFAQENRPQSVHMFGAVRYVDEEQDRQARGEAQEAQGEFDANGQLERVQLRRAVALHEREIVATHTGKNSQPLWSERQLNGDAVDLALTSDSRKSRLQEAKASGNARLDIVDPEKPDKKGTGFTRNTVGGDLLTANFVESDGRQHLNLVRGEGHTLLRQTKGLGVDETSTGDSLEVRFKPVPQRRTAAATSRGVGLESAAAGDGVATAVQQGNVVMTRNAVAKPGAAAETQRATAQRAVYDGDMERVTLTGSIELSDAEGMLWADRGSMDRLTGDAILEGGVKANYRQTSQSEVAHVLADRAEVKKDADQSLFYGSQGKPARLWQGGSQVEAPILEFTQKQRRLVARGSGQETSPAVHTVLVTNGSRSAGKAVPETKSKAPAVIRIASREMTYSDEKREADFTGSVLVESADGKMRGRQAIASLQAVNPTTKGPGIGSAAGVGSQQSFLGGSVERVVVTGEIRLEQPGRSATGEQLVYAAQDGTFVLTGSPGIEPRVMDETRGVVTGTELRFRTGDESVVISNGASSENGPRVHTETRVKR